MRDHHCEECYEPNVAEIKNSINDMMQEQILDYFQNYGSDKKLKKSKKSLTRMTKMDNHCKGRFNDFNLEEMLTEAEETDLIEIDIDT